LQKTNTSSKEVEGYKPLKLYSFEANQQVTQPNQADSGQHRYKKKIKSSTSGFGRPEGGRKKKSKLKV